jgi:hypothetical protein
LGDSRASKNPGAGTGRTGRVGRWIGLAAIVPGMLYDFAFLTLQKALRYVIPLAFLGIFLFLLFMVWLDMDQDTSATSNTVTVMLVTLSALGFTWASAIDRADPDYPPLMIISKQLMHSALLLILATGFKYALRSIPGIGFLPLDGTALRSCLWLIMAGLFTQSMLEAGMPLLKLYNLIVGKGAYLPGTALLKSHLPKAHDRFSDWLRRHGSNRMSGSPKTS